MLKNVCSNSCIEGVFREMSVSFPDYVQIITGVLLNFAKISFFFRENVRRILSSRNRDKESELQGIAKNTDNERKSVDSLKMFFSTSDIHVP